MKQEVKKNESQAREEYEPIEINVITVTPQGVLCASGGSSPSSGSKGLRPYTGF